MSLLGLFGSGGLLDSKEPQGLLGKHFSPNQAMLSMGLGMLGNGWAGALPGLQAGLKSQREADQQRQSVADMNTFFGGGSGAPQGGMGMPAVPAPMVGIGGPSPASPAGGMRGAAGGAPGNYGPVVNSIIGAESSGNANAKNPNSSATGAGQFINSTWLNTVKKHRPDVAAGKSDPQILALRNDPNLSREMTAAYAQDNAGFLQSRGLGTGPAEVYAAHHLGPAGAVKVLSASPDTPLSSLLGARELAANPHLQSMTAGSFKQWAAGKMGGGGAASAGAPAAGVGGVPSPQNAAQSFIAGLAPQQRQALARMAAQNPAIAGAFIERMIAGQKAPEGFTLGEGQVRYGADGGVIARGPDKVPEGGAGFTLGENQIRHDAQGNVIARGPEKTTSPTGTPFKLQNINGQPMLVNEQTGEVKPYGAPIPPSLSATDRKAVFTAEDENVNLEGTLAALTRAKELNPKTFIGSTAGLRGMIGSNVPGGGIVVDSEAAKATQEWQSIMSVEAIQAMSAALSGATTNFELQEFTKVMADPATPVETRGRMIDRMLSVAKRRLEVNQKRVEELRGGTYWRPGGGQSEKGEKKNPPQSILRIPDPASEQIARPKTQEEFDSLPQGAAYIDPDDGKPYRKP